jgi:hypothetical protein
MVCYMSLFQLLLVCLLLDLNYIACLLLDLNYIAVALFYIICFELKSDLFKRIFLTDGRKMRRDKAC